MRMLSSTLPFRNLRAMSNRKFTRALVIAITVFFVGALLIMVQQPAVERKSIKFTIKEAKAQKMMVIGMMRHAWDGYEKYAFGADHLLPLTKGRQDWMGLGISILDALDTAYIMGEMDIYHKCRNWIMDSFKIDPVTYSISVFETNIRVVGGFLSTYALTNDQLFLRKAKETADELLKSFDPTSGIPYRMMGGSQDDTSVADAGTLSLTFKYLSYLTNDPKYWNSVIRISKKLEPKILKEGILGMDLNVKSGSVSGPPTIGAGADSFYEYIAKQYVQTQKVENGFPPQWKAYMKKVRESLKISSKNQFMFVDGGSGSTHHLDCFLGGTIALYAIDGAKNAHSHNLTIAQLHDIDLAEELTRGCYELYHQTETHLSPETVRWEIHPGESAALEYHKTPSSDNTKTSYSTYEGTVSRLLSIKNITSGDFQIQDPQYHHRPETLESIFYLYRITGKQQYRDMGWKIFLAYQKHLKVDGSGYAGLKNANDLDAGRIDLMESFLFGETLKYLYLLFCDESVIPLDKFVFNTEAHPLPIFRITPEFRELVEWM